ncbi:hypothetical protein CXB51_012103 [Gossypium anomalum]|uniref:Small nuclear ribonucleoprotein Sm D3 n=1 Tax=Gossypium anomalum TaxID=47600 RepID=A0A8J5YQ32_9ROSI|nr:hypothetical protein CXB51_012103 [Gossypium anomalum]
MSRSLGIPGKLLHEGSGHVVTVELKSGELYRGSMIECEDNWNWQLDNITFTAKKSEVDIPFKSMFAFSLAFASLFSSSPLHQIDGKVSQHEHVFIRSNKVRFMVIQDMLKNAPMLYIFLHYAHGKSSSLGVGRGRAVAVRAKGSPPFPLLAEAQQLVEALCHLFEGYSFMMLIPENCLEVKGYSFIMLIKKKLD